MKRSRAKTLLPVITAYANGDMIQCRVKGTMFWTDVLENLEVDFIDNFEYQVKPQETK